MKLQTLNELQKIAQARYLSEFEKIRSILEKEKVLRRALRNLDEQGKSAGSSLETAQQMQMVGADLLWQRWASRTRNELNLELAQVLARKIAAMDDVRKTFGQGRAVDAIITAEKLEIRRQRTTQFLERMLER